MLAGLWVEVEPDRASFGRKTTASTLVNVAPIVIAVAATIVERERLTRRLLAGLVVAFAGAVVIAIGPGRRTVGSTERCSACWPPPPTRRR